MNCFQCLFFTVYFFIELGDTNFFFNDTCLFSASGGSFADVSSVLDDEHLSNDSENKMTKSTILKANLSKVTENIFKIYREFSNNSFE
jgi:hypothetical protein